ncbi:PatA/PatG family cyanobactin maturation protease [Gloeocapsopsis crepidinum]|uniref:PatA/PatG family cyanobactin maturation protease n=1 Tax=Gloeocapsopsis crepidinum TaxID=693223 RepID=UPI003F72B596
MNTLTRDRSNVSSAAIAIQNSTNALSGLQSLSSETLGDPRICIAVLDGPVDQSHPCFEGANLTQLQTLVSGFAKSGSVAQHGTHVASIIFGQPSSSVPGIAPGCRGLIVPVFADGQGGSLAPCSQLDLARTITQAVEQGANVINISGGHLTQSGEPDPFLTNAIQLCRDNNVLIVAATGNDGCACLHLPAAIASVLAVGAMDAQSQPMGFSNWGEAYQTNGILAPGENILGAVPGGGTKTMSGTSFATPIVSGIVALLLSLQLKQGSKPDPEAVREAILQSALPCPPPSSDCQRFLVGSLNVPGAHALITKGENLVMIAQNQEEAMIQPSATVQESTPVLEMSQPEEMNHSILETATAIVPSAATVPQQNVVPAVTPSGAEGECSCGGGKGKQVQLVYALGELGTDFGSEARRDSFTQMMPANMSLLDYLEQNPYESQSLIWTLNLDATPIYAIMPAGPYASLVYDRLRSFLRDENIERVSIPGYISGSIGLMSGQTVPVVVPEIRGIYGWSIAALIEQLMQVNSTGASEQDYRNKFQEYLERIYYEFRNLGVTPQERALNFSATNAFQIADVMSTGTAADVGLDTITVEKSPICRPDSECYDVKVKFFNLQDSRRAGKIFRFTVDVSNVIPVSIGRVRSWSVAS